MNKEQNTIIELKSSAEAAEKITKNIADTIDWVLNCKSITLYEFERQLVLRIFEIGKLFVLLFLCMREEHFFLMHPKAEANYQYQSPNARILGCFFGKIRYWRTYLYNLAVGGGYYPLDLELGLTQDGFSLLLQSYASRIATKVSYSQTVMLLTLFLQWSPAQKTIEETVLGFGKHTADWFSSTPAPDDDGEILIIQIDSKASPTATEEELGKRRGKREKDKPHSGSQRHRRKATRKSRGKKKRRKKGDKAKNGKMATIVVMYTLKRAEDSTLEGPINKWVYASYAPKRHAVAVARREANKRGFENGDGKRVQVITDGDNDLARYIEESFPNATHTIDVFHVIEYLWEAGRCLYQEGSNELKEWVEQQKEALYEGQVEKVIQEIEKRLAMLPRSAQHRLEKIRNYLEKRKKKMDYKSLLEQDLEISSGAVEGAVCYVIAQRFDKGGMRWIRERAEALLQLRCIEINGSWDGFISFVHERMRKQAEKSKKTSPLACAEPRAIALKFIIISVS
jgi:hypothetical protein